MVTYVFEILDKSKRKIHLTRERWKHIQKHPFMHDKIEDIRLTLTDPDTIRYFENDETVLYFYKEFKHNKPLERYLLISVKYLNEGGFVITSFFTNKVAGLIWKMR